MSLSDCLTSLSKIRKCFRHHGAIVKSELAKDLLGSDFEEANQLRALKDTASKRQTLMILPVAAKI